MALVDDLAEFGVMFDWITPLWTAIQNRRNGPACGCTVSADGDWSAFALRGHLAERGVKTWGWRIRQGQILFFLREAQADYAEYLLAQAGVQYGSERRRKRKGSAPTVHYSAKEDAETGFWDWF